MKNFLLSLLLTCFFVGNAQSDFSTRSIQELLAKVNTLGHQAGDINQFFTKAELNQLHAYYQAQNRMNVTFAGTDFSVDGGALTAYGAETAALLGFVSFDPAAPAVLTSISAGSGTTGFEGAGAINHDNPGVGYAADDLGVLFSIDVVTGVYTNVGNLGVPALNGMEFNPVDGTLYAINASNLYTVNTTTPSATLVGSLGLPTGALAVALAIDGNGVGYTYDLVSDNFYSINLATGAATLVGPIGFDANFGQGMGWDASTNTVYMSAFNFTSFQPEWRSVNVATGATSLVGVINPGTLAQVAWVSIVGEGGNPPAGNCDLEGTTVGGPVWDRPLETGGGMSSVGVGVTYHLYGPFTVDTAGSYEINSTQTDFDGFIFVYGVSFDPENPLTNFVAGDDDGPGGVGTSQIITNLATGTEYFLITTGFEAVDSGEFVNTITGPGTVTCDGGIDPPGEGCFATGTFDQWPSNTVVPQCVGVLETITAAGWAGEFSKVQVSAGVEYIFSSSVATDFITIADEDEEIAFITGTGSVTWTSPTDQVIRFYTHLDDDCNFEEVSRTRGVQCGDIPPPPASCDDQFVNSNNLENGLFFGGDTDQSLAVDVIVGDTGFTVYGVDLNVFTDGNLDLTFTATYFQDAGGLPGAQHATTTGTVHSSEFVGNAFGFDVYNYVVAFDTPVDLSANTTYWMQIESDGVAWEATSASILGSGLVFNNVNVSGWTNDPVTELVYKLVCDELGVSDLNNFDFSYYPNPAKDVLNISAKKNIENVSVFNLAGQQVINSKANNGQINVSALPAGTYVFRVKLEGGQMETFKIIKK